MEVVRRLTIRWNRSGNERMPVRDRKYNRFEKFVFLQALPIVQTNHRKESFRFVILGKFAFWVIAARAK